MQKLKIILLSLLLSSTVVHSQKLVTFKENNKFGFKDLKGNVVIQPKYDNAVDFFDENIGAISINNKWGFINSKGVELTELKFDAFQPENEFKIIWVAKNSKVGLINFQGKELTKTIFSDVKGFVSGSIAPVKTDSLWGYINLNGKFVTSSSYKDADNLINNRAKVVIQKDGNRRVGFIDQTGKVVIPFEYPDCTNFDSNGIAIMNDEDFNDQAIDTMGRVVIPFCYSISGFNKGLYAVKKTRDDFYVLVDSKNNIRRSTKYTWLTCSSDNLKIWRIIENGKIGYIDENFNVVIKCIYEDGSIYYTDLIPVKLNGKWGVVDLKGKVVIPFEYDKITNYNVKKGYPFIAEKNDLKYEINSEGKVLNKIGF